MPEAIAIGRLVREHGFSTYVSNPPHRCHSACGMILMSGSHMVIQSRALVGFHAGNTDEATATVATYYAELGLTDAQISAMVAMPFGGPMLIATPARAAALGFRWTSVITLFGVSQCQNSGAHYCIAYP